MLTENDEHHSSKGFMHDPTRSIALADGVFAIIMTLLVLEIKIPELTTHNELEFKQLMINCGYKLFLYAISFLLAGVYWVGHRMIFNMVKKVNNTLLWINIIFLMICSLIPFGAALLGTYPDETLALAAYGMLLTLLAGWRLLMYVYVTSHHELLFAPVPKNQRKRVIEVMLFAPIMFLLSICITGIFPTLALILYAITPPLFVTAITIVNHPAHDIL